MHDLNSACVWIAEALLIAQAFSPGLFCHGGPVGPELLLKLLRGELEPEDLEEDFGDERHQV